MTLNNHSAEILLLHFLLTFNLHTAADNSLKYNMKHTCLKCVYITRRPDIHTVWSGHSLFLLENSESPVDEVADLGFCPVSMLERIHFIRKLISTHKYSCQHAAGASISMAYHNYSKYWNILTFYHTGPNIWTSLFDSLLMYLKLLDKQQTVQTQIRCCRMQHLILVYTVYSGLSVPNT